MTKAVFWATLAVMGMAMFTACAGAQEQFCPEEDFVFEIIDNGRSVKITGYVGSNAEVRIPPRVQNLPVTEIGNGAFFSMHLHNIRMQEVEFDWEEHLIGLGLGIGISTDHQLASVIIPNSVTHIGSWAFRDNQLTSVTIGDSVTHIGNSAFRDNQLTSVTIPGNVSIEAGAFRENHLASVIIGANVRLDEVYLVFDLELDNFLRDNRAGAGTYTFNNGRWSFDFPAAASATGNRLANTVWECRQDRRNSISFGETSFSLTYWRGGREGRIAGSYTISGDFVSLVGNTLLLGPIPMTGALIGNSLTVSGFQHGFEFARVR